MYSYKAVLDGGQVRGYARSDNVFVPIVPVGQPPNGAYELFKLEQAGGATVLPADPEPLVFSGERALVGRIRTTDATPATIFTLSLALTTGYDLSSTILGVDAGNGAVRKVVSTMTAKRLLAGPLQVGTTTVIANHTDAGASTWTVSTAFVGNDLVVSVTGAAGRNVDWSIFGQMRSFSPQGGA